MHTTHNQKWEIYFETTYTAHTENNKWEAGTLNYYFNRLDS